jgi:hypothetical protein
MISTGMSRVIIIPTIKSSPDSNIRTFFDFLDIFRESHRDYPSQAGAMVKRAFSRRPIRPFDMVVLWLMISSWTRRQGQ